MKTLKISEEVFQQNFEKSDWIDNDDKFCATEIGRKLYIYSRISPNEYRLYVFNHSLKELLSNDKFVAKLLKHKLKNNSDNICYCCIFISEYSSDNMDMSDSPFELADIIHSMVYSLSEIKDYIRENGTKIDENTYSLYVDGYMCKLIDSTEIIALLYDKYNDSLSLDNYIYGKENKADSTEKIVIDDNEILSDVLNSYF